MSGEKLRVTHAFIAYRPSGGLCARTNSCLDETFLRFRGQTLYSFSEGKLVFKQAGVLPFFEEVVERVFFRVIGIVGHGVL